MQNNFFDIFKTKEQILKEKEKYLLFNPDVGEYTRKQLLKNNSNLEFNIYSKLAETHETEDIKNGKKDLYYKKYKELYGTPLIMPNPLNIFQGQEDKIKSNFDNNTEKLKEQYKNKIIDFLSNISNANQNVNKNQIYNNLKQMDDKEITKFEKENTETKSKTISNYSIKKYKGSGQFFEIIIYLLALIIGIFILKKYYDGTLLNWEKYESVRDFDCTLLDKIKNYEDIEKLDEDTSDYLALRLFHFANLPYDYGKKEEEKIFLERFKDWEIFEKNKIGKDNCFYLFKNDKNKKIIVSFPGTKIQSTQLLEEFLGSSLKNFHINNKNILISKYFGERISELLNYIFTPKVNELLKNDYKIISTGHSLGGAIAQAFIYFALTENKINKNNFPMSITFNQPKVGNQLFADFLNENSLNIRFTKGTDVVSKIPFSNFDLCDMCKYIANKSNINNKYVHTKKNINITDERSWNLPEFLKKIFLLFFLFALCFYFINLERFLSNLQINLKFFTIFVSLFYYLSFILYLYISNIIFKVAYKYGAYKFFILLLIVIIFIAYSFFLILVLVSALAYEIAIIIINFVASLEGKKHEYNKYSLKVDKFKKATYEEKISIMSFFAMISGIALGGEALKEDVLSHKETGQRTGKEKFIVKKEDLDTISEKIGEVDKKSDIGIKFVTLFDELPKTA